MGCGHCHGPDSCPMADAFRDKKNLPFSHGKLMVISCVFVFLLPLGLAIATAHLAQASLAQQVAMSPELLQGVGALVGFSAGVVIAKLAVGGLRRWLCHTNED